MASMLLSSGLWTTEYMGWCTYQPTDPMPSPECIGVRMCLYYRDNRSDSLQECYGTDIIPVMQEKLLDYDVAFNVLTPKLSSLRIPVDFQEEIIELIVFCYWATNSSITRKSERDLPVIAFRVICEAWMSYDESEAAAARAVEESMEGDECKPIPAAKSAIDGLEKVIFDCSESREKCSICLENLHPGIQVTRMPCSHFFHGDCIFKWLDTSHLCPLCRFRMPTKIC